MPRTVLSLHSSAGLYGADVQLLAIARGLDPDRWRAVCVLPERGSLAPLLEEAGASVEIRSLAVLRRSEMSPAGLARLASAAGRDGRELAALARRHEATLVHSNTSAVLGGGPAARRTGIPHLVHVREIYAGAAGRAGAALWPLMRRHLQRADALACISGAVADQFGGSRRVHVIRDGLPRAAAPPSRAAARRELRVNEAGFVVALVGRVSDWKGQDVLARALADPALAQIAAVGLVAGDEVPGSGAAATLDGLAASLGVERRLHRLGFRADIDTVLGAADALVVPSTRPEPLGLVALEGAAAGLPVVASDSGGVT